MKSSAAISGFVKQIMTALTSKTKTKSIKTRLVIFSFLRNKKILIASINHKLQVLLGPYHHNSNGNNGGTADDDDKRMSVNKAVLLDRNNNAEGELSYPDLETEGSVIELVKKTKGGEFRLEDEIDQVADLFIRRFHRQIMMQKQLSLKRNQDIILDSPLPN